MRPGEKRDCPGSAGWRRQAWQLRWAAHCSKPEYFRHTTAACMPVAGPLNITVMIVSFHLGLSNMWRGFGLILIAAKLTRAETELLKSSGFPQRCLDMCDCCDAAPVDCSCQEPDTPLHSRAAAYNVPVIHRWHLQAGRQAGVHLCTIPAHAGCSSRLSRGLRQRKSHKLGGLPAWARPCMVSI